MIAGLGILVLLALPKLDLFGDEDSSSESMGGGARRGGPVAVGIHVVRSGHLDAPLTLAGTVLPNEQVDLTAETAGKITEIAFREGGRVAEDAILVRLNDAELRASLKKAESRVKLAELEQKRKKELLDRDGISTAEYERVVNELETARAEKELIDAQRAKMEIRAPFGGRIGLRRVSRGAYVTPSTVIATLQDVDPLKVEFSVPERYAGSIVPGMTFDYAVDGLEGTRTARVYAVEPGLDVKTRTLRVRATAPNRGGDILPGQYAAVEFPTGSREPAALVPAEAVIPSQGAQSIFVVVDGRAVSRRVTIGARSERFVEITTGAAAGDSVIVAGVQSVRDGAPVRPLAH